jgi:hypothetical protein
MVPYCYRLHFSTLSVSMQIRSSTLSSQQWCVTVFSSTCISLLWFKLPPGRCWAVSRGFGNIRVSRSATVWSIRSHAHLKERAKKVGSASNLR